jgi:diacylglycerol kinase
VKEVVSAVADRLGLLVAILVGAFIAQYVLPATSLLTGVLVVLGVGVLLGLVEMAIDRFSDEEGR